VTKHDTPVTALSHMCRGYMLCEMANSLMDYEIGISFKPLFFVSTIFGLMPLSFLRADIDEDETFRFRFSDVTLLLIWSIVILIVFCGNLHMLTYIISSFEEKIKIVFILYTILVPLTKIATIITINLVNIGNIPKLIKKLLAVDQFTERRDRINMYKMIRLRIFKTEGIAFVTIVLYSAVYSCYTAGSALQFLVSSLENLCHTIHVVLCIEYVKLVRMLKYRYEYFNNILAEYFKTQNVTLVSTHISLNKQVSVNNEYVEVCALSSGRHTLARPLYECRKVQELRMVYLELYDAAMLINSRFGIPILLDILSMTTECVTALYYGFYILNINTDSYDNDLQTYVTSGFLICWSILYMTSFTYLIVCCHNTRIESNKGVYHIQRLMVNHDIKHDTALELERLSNQLRDMNIEFTACDLFALNLPFLFTILGAIFTYILIIVQLS
jgi:hypothetical protein